HPIDGEDSNLVQNPTVQLRDYPWPINPFPEVEPTTTYAQPVPVEPTTTYVPPAPSPTVEQTTTYTEKVTAPAPSTTQATQSCHATNQGLFNSYSVLIRIPYQGATDCNDTYDVLESGVPISNWQCVEKDGDTQLYFNAAIGVEISAQINGALEARCPNVTG